MALGFAQPLSAGALTAPEQLGMERAGPERMPTSLLVLI